MKSLALYAVAAALEIFGCYTFWLWLRLGRSAAWLLAGMASLALFAVALTQIESEFAGRAYAAYGGIYIAASLLWLVAVERRPPDLADVAGAALCLAGAALILFGPRRPAF